MSWMFKYVDLSEMTVAEDQFFTSFGYFQPMIALHRGKPDVGAGYQWGSSRQFSRRLHLFILQLAAQIACRRTTGCVILISSGSGYRGFT